MNLLHSVITTILSSQCLSQWFNDQKHNSQNTYALSNCESMVQRPKTQFLKYLCSWQSYLYAKACTCFQETYVKVSNEKVHCITFVCLFS